MAERLNRAAVVERAGALADEIGLEQLTITRLGRALGIAPPGVYRHVTDLDDLRRAISARATQELSAELSRECAGLADATALSALAGTVRAWAAAHPGRYAAMQIAPDPDDVEGRTAAEARTGVIAQALRAYALAGDDLIDAIRFLRSTVHGFISLEAAGGFKQPRSLDASYDRAIEALDESLRHWSAATPQPR